MKRNLIIFLVLVLTGCVHDPLVDAEDPDPDPVDPGTTCIPADGVCFESSVLPIFVANCTQSGCHNATSRKDGYILDSYSNIMRKGVNAGNGSTSKLYKVLFDGMPPDGSLTKAQKDSIKIWIDQGAKNTTNCNCFCDPTQNTYVAIVRPLINTYCTGCHSGSSPDGGINLNDYSGLKATGTNGKLIGSIKHLSGYSAMPKGSTMSSCQISQIEGWVNGGMLNN